jgi:deoxycytidine triphosphate deaminase
MTNPSQTNLQNNNPFAQDDAEAKTRFERYKSEDSFPDIQPALLNSADIYDYVVATGMIWPFDPKNLKSASYQVRLLGKCVYWDEKGELICENIENGKKFTLKKNSIAFVTVEPMFRLPDYIAVRFNLKITNVYRGLLLGTGPLVDPGFVGKLSIPLHNLTTNDYTFEGGELLIWVEFTKVSYNEKWDAWGGRAGEIRRQGKYVPFPERKNQLYSDVDDYLAKAAPHRSIRSSIPDVIQSAQKSAQEAATKARSIQISVTIGDIAITLIRLYFYLTAYL